MSAPLLMIGASFLFASMGVAVKLASAYYTSGEIVMYRGVIGLLSMALLARLQGTSLRTSVPSMHAWRAISGVSALCLWFYALGKLPVATAMTLNYMSSVWMALFLIGGAVLMGASRVDGRLVSTVLLGFVGVASILRPTIERDQLWHGLMGLLSGLLSAMAYLQVAALGRAGEPGIRVVFYFSIGGILAGLGLTFAFGGPSPHTVEGVLLLLGVGLPATAAQVMMTRAYTIGRPLVNASLQYLGIAFAFIYGVLLFDDPVTLYAIGGMLLVVGAGIAASRLHQIARPPSDNPTSTLDP